MGKKEKSGKKKGPLRKLSKIFSFKGNKQTAKGDGNETLKETHSESSVTNTPQSENSQEVCGQSADAAHVSGHSEGYSHSCFHIDCETAEDEELRTSKDKLPNISESPKNWQKSSSNHSKDTNLQPQEPHTANYPCEDKNTNFKRFTVTSVPEKATVQDDSSNGTPSGDLEAGIKPKTIDKENDKGIICHSKLNSANHATAIQNPEKQISQSSFTSDKFVSTEKHVEPYSPQPKLNIVKSKNEDKAHHENHSCHEQINFIDGQLPESQDQQLCETPQTCTENVNEHHRLKEVEIGQGLKSHTTFNDCNDHSSQSKMHNAGTSFCSSSSSRISDNHTKLNSLKTSYHSDGCGNIADENHSQTKICQNEVSFAHQFGDADSHHALQTNVDKGDPGLQNFQHSYNHRSPTDKLAVAHSDPSVSKLCSNSGDIIVSEQDRLKVCSDMEDSESEEESLTDSDSFTCDKPNAEVLAAKKENSETSNSEIRDASSMFAQDIRKSLNGLSASNLGDHSSNSNLNQTSLDKYETTSFDDEGSNIDSEDEPPELKFISQIENNHNQFPFKSHSNDNSQILPEYKGDHIDFQSNEQNDDPPYTSKHNYESFSNKDRGENNENYPSTNLIKETAKIGTKSYLPHLTSPKENGKQEASLDLKPHGNSEALVDKSSESWKKEKQSPEPKGEFAKKDEIISVQRTPSSTNSMKHSRLPVRKSLGSENTADKISRLSAEIEELSTGVKPRSDNKSKSNIPTPSRSKIPRKYVNNSPLLHSK